MAKCPICNTRKGKRKCLFQENFICSLCCGETRAAEKCGGCSYFVDTRSIRNYKKAPHYALQRMSDDIQLQSAADVIESAFCLFDTQLDGRPDDQFFKKIAELLMDRYHFKDEKLDFADNLQKQGFEVIDRIIQKDLASLPPDEISRLLGTIYRSILRRAGKGRDYINFIQEQMGFG
ncbi:MAG: hypothetical protein PF482_12915 [Desulfobacteraceae bacterium]|jgi:hypothetical protein|nr:hypothetical protein [Desulfobacteraceae bacterium]